MKIAQKNFIKATASLVGAIVGAGIFGVPFVFAQTGLLISSLIFFIIAAMLLVMHLVYGEIIERTEGQHRFLGYIGIYLGKKAKDVISVIFVLGVYGVLVAYILLAEQFFSALFGRLFGIEFLWGGVFWLFLTLAVTKGLRTVAKAEVVMMALLILTAIVILGSGVPHIDFNNFYKFDTSYIFLAYGIMLFALSGIQAVPELKSIVTNSDGVLFKKSIIAGFLISAVITLFFGVIISGVSGSATSQEAIFGILPYIGKWVVYAGAIFGILAITTSYLIFGVNLKESYVYDWKLKKIFANFLIAATPIGAILLGVHNFVGVASFIGAFFGALEGILLALLLNKARKNGIRTPGFFLKIPSFIVYLISAFLAFGGIYVIIQTVSSL